MDAIRIDGLTKEFGSVTAVDDLSFSVAEGELFGLIGPNGAGKSTLINMLVTLLGPTSGTARVNGHDIGTETGAVRDSLGIVFQEPALDEELTGAENLAFHARLYGQRKAERDARIPEVLDLVDLVEEGDRPVGEYSGGMQRRLEIGRGLLHEPAVLFLDEPTVGLDARTRRDTWEYIRRMNEESGVTIVLTTHYMEEADTLCDRVGIFDEGSLVALDTPENLRDGLGGDVVALGIEGTSTTFRDRLDDRTWVREYATTDDGVDVTLAHGETRIVDLVRLADDAGATITSVDLRKPSLENVFLSLTGSTIAEREAGGRTGDETADASGDDRRTAVAGAGE
ncbi:ATP-binding cassette domain-containing protein [Halococcus salsus]|uniref:ATP-binding cassette domain-containing protein n=1 Tax=Halococcus salsus TaxID=2162894 RepID=UPI001357E2A1|nr:ATP-binding cassette domain-containing protein [Halococcus salsus]